MKKDDFHDSTKSVIEAISVSRGSNSSMNLGSASFPSYASVYQVFTLCQVLHKIFGSKKPPFLGREVGACFHEMIRFTQIIKVRSCVHDLPSVECDKVTTRLIA